MQRQTRHEPKRRRFNSTDWIIILIFAVVAFLIAISVLRVQFVDCRVVEQNITICKDKSQWKWEVPAQFFNW